MTGFKRILCPTDFSELSAHALTYARGLAQPFDAKLFLLHVVDEAYQSWSMMGANGIPIGPPPDEMLAAARVGMTKFVHANFPSDSAAPATEVRMGRPFLEIIRHAREIGADLIVLGTHGRTGLSHMLLGSVADRVVRKAPCAVLTIRHPDTKFSMP